MYETSRFAKKLNIQNCENSMVNCVHCICTEWLDLPKNWISRAAKIWRKILYVVYVWNVWICQKIEYPELRNFKGKFCTLYMYERSGFTEKLNIQNYENSMGNCLHYICTEGLDFLKIEYPELWKFNGKFSTLYMYRMARFEK